MNEDQKNTLEQSEEKKVESEAQAESLLDDNGDISDGNQVSSAEDELKAMKEKYLRLVAEFDNYRKRTNRERLEMISRASEDVLSKLLPVLDDFERAKMSAEDENNEEQFTEGVQLVYDKLFKTLDGIGLKPMDSKGNDFDPEYHEAITEIDTGDKKMKGKIVDVIERGYLLGQSIMRHAKVVVGK
jgi:molecular chaperone GrpE